MDQTSNDSSACYCHTCTNTESLLKLIFNLHLVFYSISRLLFASHGNISFFLPLTERLAEGEFIKGVIENENAMRLIHYERLKQ